MNLTADLHFLGLDVSVPYYVETSSFEEAKRSFMETIGSFERFKELREYLEAIDLIDQIENIPPEFDKAAVICVRGIRTDDLQKSNENSNRDVYAGPSSALFKPDTYEIKQDPKNQSKAYRIKIVKHEPSSVEEIEIPNYVRHIL
jgi:hypothetical protein